MGMALQGALMAGTAGVRSIAIEDEMDKSFLDYAMSVIVARALPDVRDGLKPVHRRILWGMNNLREFKSSNTKTAKSARAVGEVMAKYHPHGDSAIYDAMVRLTQPFSNLHPLIVGQGNFSNRDGDPAAAMRYTEARLHKLADEVLGDIEKMPAEFWRENYDRELKEPRVLPAKFPHILVNGGLGIAVGMATNIPAHNLAETIDACLLLMDNPAATLDDVMAILPGPDFPVRCKIMGRGGIRKAYETGRGSIRMSGEASIETLKGGRNQIVITSLPFGVSANGMVQRVADLIDPKDKKGNRIKQAADWRGLLDGATEVRDESDRTDDVRVVIELSRDAEPTIVMNALVKYTDFVCSFGYNATVLNSRGRPEVMPLMRILEEFVAFRRVVIRKRTIGELDAARDKLHEQIGLYAAASIIDAVVQTIRSSPDADTARARLMAIDFPTADGLAQLLSEADPDTEVGDLFRLSEIQANVILGMRLRALTGLARDEVAAGVRALSSEINGYLAILNDASVLDGVIRTEFALIRSKFGRARGTAIEADLEDVDDEDLIERKEVVLTITQSNYVKWTDLAAYREQKRGGKGRNGMETKDDDIVQTTIVCTTKTPLVFFTSKGMAHRLKTYRLPEGAPSAKGRPIINFLPLEQEEKVIAVIAMPETEEELDGKSILFVTEKGDVGKVRRNDARAFWGINKAGKIAIKLDGSSSGADTDEDDDGVAARLVDVMLASDADDAVLIATRLGKCVRFPVTDLPQIKSRSGLGHKAVKLGMDDTVIGASVLRNFPATPQERDAYERGGTLAIKQEDGSEETFVLPEDRLEAMRAAEELVMTITALGFGKRSSSYEYRTTARGAKGIDAATITSATGPLIACFTATDEDGLVLTTDGGQTIRTRVRDVRITGRTTRGVRMFQMPKGQRIVGVAKVSADDVADEEEPTGE